MSEDRLDDMGEEFGRLRRRCRDMAAKAIRAVDTQSAKDAARSFRRATFAHLGRIERSLSRPSSYFSEEQFDAAVRLARQTGDGIPAKKAQEFAKRVIDGLLSHTSGMLLLRTPYMPDWRNLGISVDEASRTIYARMYDSADGKVSANTVPVAYYDSMYMVPAEDSAWFWTSDIGLAVRVPVSMPFEKADADPVNDPDTVRDYADKSVVQALDDCKDALSAAQGVSDPDAVEKLRIQVDISFNKCLPLNKHIADNADHFRALLRDQPVEAAKMIIDWLESYLEEAKALSSMRQTYLNVDRHLLHVPSTAPGVTRKFLVESFSDEQLRAFATEAVDRAINRLAAGKGVQLGDVLQDVQRFVGSDLGALPDDEEKALKTLRKRLEDAPSE